MKKINFYILLLLCISLVSCVLSEAQDGETSDPRFNSITIDPQQKELKMYWKDADGELYRSLGNLNSAIEKNNENLIVAMNGGIYMENRTPLGLFIEGGEIQTKINSTQNAYGNFYLQPNGIFYFTENNTAHVTQTADFELDSDITFATQSGPMLLIDGRIHPKFNKGSENINIRNGIGILPNGDVLMAISKVQTNLYDFANFFLEKGCDNALYLDGFVSRMYCPEKGLYDKGGNFGVIIGVTEKR